MKKIFLMFCMALLICAAAAPAMAADWTITCSVVYVDGYTNAGNSTVVASSNVHNVYVSFLCASNGSALSATNLFDAYKVSGMTGAIRDLMTQGRLIVLDVHPGTGDTAPTAAIDVTLTNEKGALILDEEDYSYSANTDNVDMAKDRGYAPMTTDEFYLDLNDIGDSGDTVELLFEVYIP